MSIFHSWQEYDYIYVYISDSLNHELTDYVLYCQWFGNLEIVSQVGLIKYGSVYIVYEMKY